MNTTTVDLRVLHADADTALAYGGKITDRFTSIRERWDTLTASDDHDVLTPVCDLLTGDDDPDPADLTLSLAMADLRSLIAAKPALRADVRNRIAARLLPVQRAEWARTLVENYTTAAKAYTAAAGDLVAILDTVGDTTTETIASASAKVREAWVRLPAQRAQVDAAADALAFFASVNQVDAGPANLGLYATIPTTADRRAVWAAIDADHGPAGLWGTLHNLGARLAAPEQPTDVHGYRRPKPFETRYIRAGLGWRPVDYDPETGQPQDAVPAGGTPLTS